MLRQTFATPALAGAKTTLMKSVKFLLLGLAIAIPLALYFTNPFGTATYDPRARLLGFMVYHIPSASMRPTLETGDYILVKTFAFTNSAPELGDIVVYRPPHQDTPFVGRVMARSGDRISFRESTARVNGQPQREGYILGQGKTCHASDIPETLVPHGMLYIVADNRCNSIDSRKFGHVRKDSLIGKVFYTWKPN